LKKKREWQSGCPPYGFPLTEGKKGGVQKGYKSRWAGLPPNSSSRPSGTSKKERKKRISRKRKKRYTFRHTSFRVPRRPDRKPLGGGKKRSSWKRGGGGKSGWGLPLFDSASLSPLRKQASQRGKGKKKKQKGGKEKRGTPYERPLPLSN